MCLQIFNYDDITVESWVQMGNNLEGPTTDENEQFGKAVDISHPMAPSFLLALCTTVWDLMATLD